MVGCYGLVLSFIGRFRHCHQAPNGKTLALKCSATISLLLLAPSHFETRPRNVSKHQRINRCSCEKTKKKSNQNKNSNNNVNDVCEECKCSHLISSWDVLCTMTMTLICSATWERRVKREKGRESVCLSASKCVVLQDQINDDGDEDRHHHHHL